MMPTQYFDEIYQIVPNNGRSQCTDIDRHLQQYEKNYKVKDSQRLYVQEWAPTVSEIESAIQYFGYLQNNMINDIFKRLEKLAVKPSDYDHYYNNILSLVSASPIDANQANPNYYVYRKASETLNKIHHWLENYVNALRLSKTLNDEERALIEKRINIHNELSGSNKKFSEEGKIYLSRVIDTQHHTDDETPNLYHKQAHQTNVREQNATLHATFSKILGTINQNKTITLKEYDFLVEYMDKIDTDYDEASELNETILIARKMIEISPGFDVMGTTIDANLVSFTEQSLLQFTTCIGGHITAISTDLDEARVTVMEKVLRLNIYLKIFRNIVPKLPLLLSADAEVRYDKHQYHVPDILSGTNHADTNPQIFKLIHASYQEDLQKLKACAESFLLKLVDEINAKVKEYFERPTEILANEIIERLAGHQQCLMNYRELYPTLSTEGLSNFVLNEELILSSDDMIKSLFTFIAEHAYDQTKYYSLFDNSNALALAISRYAYLRRAHYIIHYSAQTSKQIEEHDQTLFSLFNNKNARIKDQLYISDQDDFIMFMGSIVFFNRLFKSALLDPLNFNRSQIEDLIYDMISRICNNTKRENEIYLYESLAAFIKNSKCNGNVSQLMSHILPYPEVPRSSNAHILNVEALVPVSSQDQNPYLNPIQVNSIGLILLMHREITEIQFGKIRINSKNLKNVLEQYPQVKTIVFSGLRSVDANLLTVQLTLPHQAFISTQNEDELSAKTTITRTVNISEKLNITAGEGSETEQNCITVLQAVYEKNMNASEAFALSKRRIVDMNIQRFCSIAWTLSTTLNSIEFIEKLALLCLDENQPALAEQWVNILSKNPTPAYIRIAHQILMQNPSSKILVKFSEITRDSPLFLSPEQYQDIIEKIVEDYKNHKNPDTLAALLNVFRAYHAALDILHDYTNQTILCDYYHVIDGIIDFIPNEILTELQSSSLFASHYSINSVKKQFSQDNSDRSKNIVRGVVKYNSQLVSFILTQYEKNQYPDDIDLFENQMSILMENPAPADNNRASSSSNPLTDESSASAQQSHSQTIFIDAFICYIMKNKGLHFIKHVDRYINHIISFRLQLTAKQAVNLLTAINNMLSDAQFKRMQELTIRLLVILPDVKAGTHSPLEKELTTLVNRSITLSTHHLIKVLRDELSIRPLLEATIFDAYKPKTESALPEVASHICEHFNDKLNMDIQSRLIRIQERNNYNRLSNQMKKLDKILILFDTLSRISDINQHHSIYNATIIELSQNEKSVFSSPSEFFKSPTPPKKELSELIADFRDSKPSVKDIKALESRLVENHDRLMDLMFSKYLNDLKERVEAHFEANHYQFESACLNTLLNFVKERRDYLCSDYQTATRILVEARSSLAQSTHCFKFLLTGHKEADTLINSLSPICVKHTSTDTYGRLYHKITLAISKLDEKNALANVPGNTRANAPTIQKTIITI